MGMNERGVLLRLIMEEFDVDDKLSTFSARLMFQKSVYLLQALGMSTDFYYGWYLRGPYSPSLTRTAFEDVVKPCEQGDKTYEGFELNEPANGRVSKIKEMLQRKPEGYEKENWLELLASMHFYRYEMYFPPKDNSNRKKPSWLYDQLPPAKRRLFKLKEAVAACNMLTEVGLWKDRQSS